jgi:polysaccharide pyruvyl transferase WcaK-like protein
VIIEVKGAGFDNYGAWLMLTSVTQRLEVLAPGATIALASRGDVTASRRRNLGALRKIDLRIRWLDLNGLTSLIPKFIRHIFREWGFVLECDVTAIIDIAGFGYSDQWGSDFAIRHAVAEVRRFAGSGRKYLFMPQAFGPFEATNTRKLIRAHLPKASLVAARDPVSYHHIREITDDFDALKRFGDFTNSVVCSEVKVDRPSVPYMVVVPNANMLSSYNTNQAWLAGYQGLLEASISYATELDLDVVLMQFGGDMDKRVIENLSRQFPHVMTGVKVESDVEAKAMIEGARLVVSSRYHACVCALSAGIPCLGTSWSHKYETLFNEYEVSELLMVPDTSLADLQQTMRSLIDTDMGLRHRLIERASVRKDETEELWRLVEQILSS